MATTNWDMVRNRTLYSLVRSPHLRQSNGGPVFAIKRGLLHKRSNNWSGFIHPSQSRCVLRWPATLVTWMVVFLIWCSLRALGSDAFYSDLSFGHTIKDIGFGSVFDFHVNDNSVYSQLWQKMKFYIPINWDAVSVLTIVCVMFVAVLSSVLAVSIAQNSVLKETKEEIRKGFKQINETLDKKKTPTCK